MVTFGSKVDRMAMPSGFQMMTPCTPLCDWMRLSVSSTSDIDEGRGETSGRSHNRRRVSLFFNVCTFPEDC